jgi:probable short chain dehydrogenase
LAFLFYLFLGVFMNKVAIVTGGASGIGLSIAEKLLKNNYQVIISYNSSTDSARSLLEKYENLDIFQIDLSNPENTQSLIDFAFSKYRKIDLLVNNAGVDLVKMINDTTFDDFDYIMKVNLYSPYFLARGVAKHMIDAKYGNIINISSILGITGGSCESAYSISKAGLDGLTKSLAQELGPSNIRVNSIAPGLIDTKMNSNLTTDEINNLVMDFPISRIGTPDDVADLVLYLEHASYVTGQVIQVNGGWNI